MALLHCKRVERALSVCKGATHSSRLILQIMARLRGSYVPGLLLCLFGGLGEAHRYTACWTRESPIAQHCDSSWSTFKLFACARRCMHCWAPCMPAPSTVALSRPCRCAMPDATADSVRSRGFWSCHFVQRPSSCQERLQGAVEAFECRASTASRGTRRLAGMLPHEHFLSGTVPSMQSRLGPKRGMNGGCSDMWDAWGTSSVDRGLVRREADCGCEKRHEWGLQRHVGCMGNVISGERACKKGGWLWLQRHAPVPTTLTVDSKRNRKCWP